MISSTWARVEAATSGRPLRTFETVGMDTPASAAIWAIVGEAEPVWGMAGPGLSGLSRNATFKATVAPSMPGGEAKVTDRPRCVQIDGKRLKGLEGLSTVRVSERFRTPLETCERTRRCDAEGTQ